MNTKFLLRISAIILALVGAMGYGHLLANATVSHYWGEDFAHATVPVALWVGHWVVTPTILIIAAVLAFVPNDKASKMAPIFLSLSSALFLIIWVVFSSNSYFFPNFAEAIFENHDWSSWDPAVFASLAAYSAPFVVVGGGLSLWVWLLNRKAAAEAAGESLKKRRSATMLSALFDSKLENFISRKVSGVIYVITAALLVLAWFIFEIFMLTQIFNPYLWVQALVLFFLSPFALVLVLIVVRMAFESGIALIVIAENTKK